MFTWTPVLQYNSSFSCQADHWLEQVLQATALFSAWQIARAQTHRVQPHRTKGITSVRHRMRQAHRPERPGNFCGSRSQILGLLMTVLDCRLQPTEIRKKFFVSRPSQRTHNIVSMAHIACSTLKNCFLCEHIHTPCQTLSAVSAKPPQLVLKPTCHPSKYPSMQYHAGKRLKPDGTVSQLSALLYL